MRLVHALFARLVERAWRGVTHDRALAVWGWSVIRVLVVCEDSPWRLGFAAGAGVVGGCFEEHLIDGKGALGRAGGRSLLGVGSRATWRGESGLVRGMRGREMGAMVDIDIEGSDTGMGLKVMSGRVQAWVDHVPCHSRVRYGGALQGAGRVRADRRTRQSCPSGA